MIRIEELSKSVNGRNLFSGVSLRILAGEHVVLTGPSGSGKSTLLRILAGLDCADAGRIELLGKLASNNERHLLAPHKRELALVFQDLGLWPHLNVIRNVAGGLSKYRLPRSEHLGRSREMLELCEIGHLEKRTPRQLSAGEQQRVALARALVAKPNILLLDEPFAALDMVLRRKFFELLQHLVGDAICCLTVTHDPSDAIGLRADRIYCLESGRLLDGASLEAMKTQDVESKTLQTWKNQMNQS